MAFIAVALLHICLAATSTTAARTSIDLRREPWEGPWDVNIIVARHGVSCTNVIEKWSSLGGADFKRGYMLDPPLAGMADQGNVDAREALERWKRQSGSTIDAVMSSVLLRAMQTAVSMHDAEPLYVAPFLREHAKGDSNAPANANEQKAALQEMNPSQEVVFSFVETRDGYKKGTWENFVTFLKDDFLPFTIGQRDAAAAPKRDITLLVATHSKFLKEHARALSDRCKHLWNPKDGKPFNSQVFMVKYTFMPGCDGCQGSSLQPQGIHCEEIYHGTTIYDEAGKLKRLCVSDMGDRCTEKIARYSLSPRPLIKKTLEWEVALQSHEVYKSNERIKSARQALGCDEEEDDTACQERLSGSKKLVKKLKDALQADQVVVHKLYLLLDTDCVGGGFPEVKQLARYKDLELPPGLLPHTGPTQV